jgi:hypothetical protein
VPRRVAPFLLKAWSGGGGVTFSQKFFIFVATLPAFFIFLIGCQVHKSEIKLINARPVSEVTTTGKKKNFQVTTSLTEADDKSKINVALSWTFEANEEETKYELSWWTLISLIEGEKKTLLRQRTDRNQGFYTELTRGNIYEFEIKCSTQDVARVKVDLRDY